MVISHRSARFGGPYGAGPLASVLTEGSDFEHLAARHPCFSKDLGKGRRLPYPIGGKRRFTGLFLMIAVLVSA